MDSTGNNYDILMRSINCELYWQNVVITDGPLMIIIDVNVQNDFSL
jgi:hypothetical protein